MTDDDDALDLEILELFGEAAHMRGHVRSEPGRKAGARPFDFGELTTDRLHRTTKREREAEAREMARYYMRQWKAAVRADPAKRARYLEMARRYAREGWQRLKADPKRHERLNAWKRKAYAENRDAISAQRRASYDAAKRREEQERMRADPERAARDAELARARRARWYERLKTDPVRYERYLARAAKRNARVSRSKARAAGLPPRTCSACGQPGHNRRTCATDAPERVA